MEKLPLDDTPWFGTTNFKGKNQLTSDSDVRLKSSRLLYPLPLPLEILFFIGPLTLAILPFINPSLMLPEAWLMLNIGAIISYLLLKKLFINSIYGRAKAHVCQINAERVCIPGSPLIDIKAGPLEMQRRDIKEIGVRYWPSTRDLRTTYDVSELIITVQSGKSICLKSLYFPIKPLLYLLVYFDYPIATQKRRHSLTIVARSLFVAFPIVALVAVTGLLFKEYFL
ncbi:hypothetical protein K0I63_03285 [Shewanella rhizosphaerae]|uniref:hypothetical protein n=1 Tax=Shewanella rhizosphaerae TaxID=2864207 RepID=UPI001C6622A2|nr:hypothetical protein [Shewanella rhizosphaerae]QYK13553.1 hypothetical protein K0I63_03285 [Shewanella rhizosphaerae]